MTDGAGGVVEGRSLVVRFGTAAEVLDSYWGFLANGGLVLGDDLDLSEGEPIQLEVTIESSNTLVRLRGQVMKQTPGRKRAVIAFDPDQPQEKLLTAAWAEVENVPARRHRRFPLEGSVRLADRGGGKTLEPRGKVVNLSSGGLCLRTPHALPLALEDQVLLVTDAGTVPAIVRWVSGTELGFEFAGSATENDAFSRALR